MKEYRLMKTDYVTSCVWHTNDVMEMKNKIIEILAERWKTSYYALAGINKYKEDFYEGAWVDVWQDGKLIQSKMIEEGFELE